ncbi:LysR family transcriptional regulator [Halobacteriovorax sp. GB3]|uniref:LysR family transcriptional regulator n=1 Tax=Halobacteriovorax sp. GB3 TaxID=2719615 RepID=UPI0023614C79|nr:LysR family transcriptional regulator [Halobacteriovorax sp. GB3]MDD0851621.1 LysR family transcriptional regulator [Halobacteriovorax sp. GB3]
MKITFQQLETFLKVAYYLNFSKAAEKLRLPATTVSSQISSLEKELGFKLFKRTSRMVTLTDKGLAYKESALKAYTILKEAQSINEIDAPLEGNIKLTLPIDIPRASFTKLIKSFQADYPLINFELILDDRVESLTDKDFDIAIRVGMPTQKDFICKSIGDTSFSFFASKEFIRKNKITMVSKKDYPQVLDCHGLLKSSKCNKSLKTNNFEMAKEFAINSMAISFLPNSLCEKEIKLKILQRIDSDISFKSKKIYLVYPSKNLLEKHVRRFIDYASRFDFYFGE